MWGATDRTYLRMQYDSVRALSLSRYVNNTQHKEGSVLMLTPFGSGMPHCCRTNQVIIGSLSAHVFSALALTDKVSGGISEVQFSLLLEFCLGTKI